MKVIFLTGHRKSGTTLLSNLLDDVDGLCVYPTDLALLYAYFPKYNNNKYSYKFKHSRLKKIIFKSLKTNLEYSNTIYKFDIKKFTSMFLTKINNNNIDKIEKIIKILIQIYLKYFKKIFEKKRIKYFVLKETSCGYLAKELNSWFPKMKFIQIIRDPRDNYASLKSGLKSHYNKIGEDKLILLSSMINRLQLDFKYIDINRKKFPGRYKIIKFENLVKKPKKTTKEICKFINIKFEKNILKPTILGKGSKGNNYEGVNFKKISKINAGNWKKRINQVETNIIEFFLRDEMLKLKYKFSLKNHDFDSIKDYYSQINQKFYFKDSYR